MGTGSPQRLPGWNVIVPIVVATLLLLVVGDTGRMAGAYDIPTATTLTLSPKTSTNPVETQLCLTATVTDQNDQPMVGEQITFSLSGENVGQLAASRVTDPNGEAINCYTGIMPGVDTITAVDERPYRHSYGSLDQQLRSGR